MAIEETISQALRRAVRDFPMAQGRIAKLADIQAANLSRFMTEKMELRTESLDRLCAVLDLTLAPIPPDPAMTSLGHGFTLQDRQHRAEATEARLNELEVRLNARIDEVVSMLKQLVEERGAIEKKQGPESGTAS